MIHNIKDNITCKKCDKFTKFRNFTLGYRKHCSSICAGSSINVLNARKQTCNTLYGVHNVRSSNLIKSKIKQTKLIRYGNENYNNSPEYDFKKYFKHTLKKRIQNKYIPLFKSDEFVGCHYTNEYNWECVKCNNTFIDNVYNGKLPRCPKCYPKTISSFELELQEFFKNETLETSNRDIIKPLELDLYLPKYNLAIEFNGNYWHSEKYDKDRNYHLNKTNLCKDKNIQLIHIFEDEWLNKKRVCKNRLKNLIGQSKSIGARKCKIREISSTLKNKFLEKYHIQGKDNSSIKLGLFYKNRLVSVMTFGKRRFDKKAGYELYRFCNIGSFNILGGASKLFKHFIKNYKPSSVITYADKRWSKSGGLYKNLGFTQLKDTQPGYFYTKGMIREGRQKYMKHKLENLLENFDETLTEKENMENNNFYRIWDCGNFKFEWSKK